MDVWVPGKNTDTPTQQPLLVLKRSIEPLNGARANLCVTKVLPHCAAASSPKRAVNAALTVANAVPTAAK